MRLDVTNFKRMVTKVQDNAMDDSDLRLVINADYDKVGGIRKVKGYTQVGDALTGVVSQKFVSDADWNTGAHSSTEAISNSLLLQGGIISQPLYNDSHIVYGANWFAESFKPTGSSINKITLFLDKVLGSALQLYDNFDDNSIDASKWTTAQSVSETGGRLRVYWTVNGGGKTSTISTGGKTGATPPGQPILGFKVDSSVTNRGIEGKSTAWFEITDGTDYIRVGFGMGVDQLHINSTAYYGSANGVEQWRWDGNGGTIEVKQEGADIKLYQNGILKNTIYNTAIKANSYFDGIGDSENTDDSTDHYFELDNLYFYTNVTALVDAALRIETNNSGVPSGSAITNGTATVVSANVGSSVGPVEVTFSTPPTVTAGTLYWIIFKQSAGDASNYYRAYKQNTNVYSDGDVFTSTNSGGTWTADTDGATDAAFIVYGGYLSSGNWISPSITLASGQTLSQLTFYHHDLSPANYITQIDILDTSNVSQASYTTDIISGTMTILRSTDISFNYTLNNSFRIKISLVSATAISPAVEQLILDSPTQEILMLSPLYQTNGTRMLLAIVAGTVKRLVSTSWTTIYSALTSGLKTSSVIFRASKGTKIDSGTASSGNLTSLTATFSPPLGVNTYQGKMIKIVKGTGVGQMRVIQYNDGTTTSTSTSSSTTTTRSTSSSTTKSTSTTTT